MKLYIKNMVCNRCKLVVTTELKKLGLSPLSVELGEVTFADDITDNDKQRIEKVLEPIGFSIIDDRKSRTIEKIKALIVDLVHNQDGELKTNLSDYLSDRLHHEYGYLSGLFSEVEGTTIEKYFIAQKIERVKELLVYDEQTLSEIAFKLNYSSVAHLSNQFKKVTGLTPSHFKNIGIRKRKPLDEV
jgi:AraC-like DNA-binding protein